MVNQLSSVEHLLLAEVWRPYSKVHDRVYAVIQGEPGKKLGLTYRPHVTISGRELLAIVKICIRVYNLLKDNRERTLTKGGFSKLRCVLGFQDSVDSVSRARSLCGALSASRALYPQAATWQDKVDQSGLLGPFACRAASGRTDSCHFSSPSRRFPTMPSLDTVIDSVSAPQKGDKDLYAESVSSPPLPHSPPAEESSAPRNISPQATWKKGEREGRTEKVISFLMGCATETASTA